MCLGHQAIGAAFGAQVQIANNLMHGKSCLVDHDGAGCYLGIETPLKVTRYHSLIVSDENLPNSLAVTSRSRGDGYIMGLRHRDHPIETLQYHPESIGTDQGMRLLNNFMQVYVVAMSNAERNLSPMSQINCDSRQIGGMRP